MSVKTVNGLLGVTIQIIVKQDYYAPPENTFAVFRENENYKISSTSKRVEDGLFKRWKMIEIGSNLADLIKSGLAIAGVVLVVYFIFKNGL
jgi:hypothetical protein